MKLSPDYQLPFEVRVWSNRQLEKIASLFSGEVINVSGWKDADKEGRHYRDYFISATNYYVSNHTGSRGFKDNPETDFSIDLISKLSDDLLERFDVVFNHTTLEHIFDVNIAFRNLCLLSKDVVILVVPFSQKLHYEQSYGDYWRFTPMSLRALFAANEYEVVYESASPYKNNVIYLFCVGSKYPENWLGKMPPWEKIEKLGDWIGETNNNRFSKLFSILRPWLKGLGRRKTEANK